MSIEKRLEELTEAISTLPAAIAAAMGSVQSGTASNCANTTTPETTTQEQPKVDSKPADEEKVEQKVDADVAGRKTYVFDKTTKTGFIVEKGEELPVGDNFVKVAKTKWEQLCEKYELDTETGNKVEAPAPDKEFDDLDDEELADTTESSDDDLDLGLDDDPEEGALDRATVKARVVDLMRTKGREDVLKLFKKYGSRNFDEVKDEDLQSLYDAAGKLLK